jgi:hypothetical protein
MQVFAPTLIDHDEFDQQISPGAALRRTRIDEPGIGVYRGWMLRSEATRVCSMHFSIEVFTSPEEVCRVS